MDRFTRNYIAGLVIIVIVFAVIGIRSSWQPRADELNVMLQADPLVVNYPYRFRVVSYQDGVATMLTPRNFDIPAYRFLQVIYPRLHGLAEDDPAMAAAQQALVNAQKRALDLVEAQPDVKSVHWSLDVRWLADHGIAGPIPR
jgi:hypothetical protein